MPDAPTPDRIVIGLSGYAGTGKDTAADIIVRILAPNVRRTAFADAVRAELAQAFHVDVGLFLRRDLKTAPLHELRPNRCSDPAFRLHLLRSRLPNDPLSPRHVLQQWGDDYRRTQDPCYWVSQVSEKFRAMPAGVAAVITDVRYPNEASWLHSVGGYLVRITRAGTAPALGHRSDLGVDLLQHDHVIANDGTVEDLETELSDALRAIAAVGRWR